MIYRLAGIFLVLGFCVTCGCVSQRSDDVLAQILQEIAVEQEGAAQEDEGPDAPAKPVSNLPELSPEIEAAVGKGVSLTIQPDSQLRIAVKEDPGLGGSFMVSDIGAIKLGYIGPVILDNLTEEGAERKIRKILEGREFHTATVDVQILRASYDKLRIDGDVRRPGLIKVGAGDVVSLNNALIRAGGIQYPAKYTRIKIVRGGLLSAVWPSLPGEMYSLVDENGYPGVPDVFLRNNDVVLVSSLAAKKSQKARSNWVLVLGEVSKEGYYSFEGTAKFTMMNLILKMNGLPRYANEKKVRVVRTDREGNEEEFVVDVRDLMEEGDPELDFDLQNGDRIIVPERRISIW